MSELNKLKEISVEDLEKAISKTISELLNRKYDCSISNIAYGVLDKADFQVSIYLQHDFMNHTEKSE